MDLTSTDFSHLALAANIEIGERSNGNYPSPMLSRDGEEVIFQENTVGIIRQATVFKLKDRKPLLWSNPSVFLEGDRIIFKCNDLGTLGAEVTINQNGRFLFTPAPQR